MLIRIGYKLTYRCVQATPMVMCLHVHPSRINDLLSPQNLSVTPEQPIGLYRDLYDNICTRVLAPAGDITFTYDGLIRDSGRPDEVAPDAVQHRIEDLPDETIGYLLPSRYCESDVLSDFAWKEFGHLAPGWSRVQAVVEFVHNRIRFGYQDARSTRTAAEGLNEGVGVCRDFAHLSITLCRALNVPARYCTGFLGDIGVPKDPAPMDFSAWFEAFLNGRWYTFDARHNAPRIGRIVMARGRDAADVPISTTFGPNTLTEFTVVTDEIEESRPPVPAVSA